MIIKKIEKYPIHNHDSSDYGYTCDHSTILSFLLQMNNQRSLNDGWLLILLINSLSSFLWNWICWKIHIWNKSNVFSFFYLFTSCQWVLAFPEYQKEKVSFTVHDSTISGKKEIRMKEMQIWWNSPRWSSCIYTYCYTSS